MSELTGPELDLAVAKAMGNDSAEINHRRVATRWPGGPPFEPSIDWEIGGPIIEREKIATVMLSGEWRAFTVDKGVMGHGNDPDYWLFEVTAEDADASGPTPLIAAMRAFVASKAK